MIKFLFFYKPPSIFNIFPLKYLLFIIKFIPLIISFTSPNLFNGISETIFFYFFHWYFRWVDLILIYPGDKHATLILMAQILSTKF